MAAATPETAEGPAAGTPSVAAADLRAALAPLLERIDARAVRDPGPDDVAITLGDTTIHVRLADGAESAAEPTDLSDGLARLISDVEDELGGPLSGLSRAQKQVAVRLLEERGAFEMRRSAETVAEAMGLTRFTVYNYLNRLREGAAGSR